MLAVVLIAETFCSSFSPALSLAWATEATLSATTTQNEEKDVFTLLKERAASLLTGKAASSSATPSPEPEPEKDIFTLLKERAAGLLPEKEPPRPVIEGLVKQHYRLDEKVKFIVKEGKSSGIKAQVTNSQGQEIQVTFSEQTLGTTKELQMIPPTSFRPGKYHVTLADSKGVLTEQDFTWGVLAINPDKATYITNETAHFAMAVLDDEGKMVCTATVTLEITSPSGKKATLSTTDKTIAVSPECTKHQFSLIPDYSGSLQLEDEIGTYQMKLISQTPNGEYSVDDSFMVKTAAYFDITRTAATRIYPVEQYPVTITVKANQDFSGKITETVPEEFIILKPEKEKGQSFNSITTQSLPTQGKVLGDSTALTLQMPFNGGYSITQGFGGMPDSPILQVAYKHAGLFGHDGIDYALPDKTPVFSADTGKVIESGPGFYGVQVAVKHSWGTTYYGHLSETKVTVGEDVKPGDLVGLSGNTGLSTGYHLHFAVKPNDAPLLNGYVGKVDPQPFLTAEDGVVAGTQTSASQVKVISWDVNLKQGDTITLGYRFDAPDVSPYFYGTGPLKFYPAGSTVPNYDEGRYWQLAIDDLSKKLEQEINFLNQEYMVGSNTDVPTDKSLGVIHWDASKYPGATVYFEAVLKAYNSSYYPIATLYNVDGTPVASSTINTTSTSYTRVRSGAITLSDNTDYTVRVKNNTATISNAAYIKAARLIIVQSDATKLTATQGQVELGSAEGTSSTTYQNIVSPKLYKYDEGRFSPTPATYFEGTLQGASPKLEQQINILNQVYYTGSNSDSPADNSLGVIHWDASKYPGATVYFEAILKGYNGSYYPIATLYSTSGTPVAGSTINTTSSSYTRIRSGAITLTDNTDYTVRLKASIATTNASYFGYIKAARLIIVQSDATKLTATQGQIEVGNAETTGSTSYQTLLHPKIYNYDSSKFTPAPTAYFEATMQGASPKFEQQINLIDQEVATNSTTDFPTDNSLGLFHWDAAKYPGATVYFETVIRTCCAGAATATLYDAAGNAVADSTLTISSNSTYTKFRSGAITLSDNTDYTVRLKSSNSSSVYMQTARIIIVQSDPTRITATESQIEIGDAEGTNNNTYQNLVNPKIYAYDSTKFTPTPTAYFEAAMRGDAPRIEHQINILNQEYITNSTSFVPTNNALGLVHWDAAKYPGATVYFEAVISHGALGTGVATLYDTAGNAVIDSTLSVGASGGYTRVRSTALTLSDNTDYTVQVKSTNASYSTSIKAARLIVLQSDATKITDTQSQIEIGNSEATNNTTYQNLSIPKIYAYDSSKFTPAPTAYFEADIKGSSPKLEQQINIIDQAYTTTSTSYAPTDNSLGLVHWDAAKYPGATVYFEALLSHSTLGTGYATLFDAAGNAVIDSTLSVGATGGYTRVRSTALTLSDNTDYSVQIKTSSASYSTSIKAARLIIVQADSTKLTDTQGQVEIGNNETTTSASYTPLTNKKIYYYDSSKFTPAPTAYFEASLSNNTAGQVAYAALYTDGATCTSQVAGSEVTVTGTTWTRVRSAAITINNGTSYMVCVKAGANTARIANAKIILDQNDTNGITATEVIHQQINTLYSYASNNYGAGQTDNPTLFDFDSFGVMPAVFLETTAKSAAGGTVYVQTYGYYDNISSEVNTNSTAYTRIRSSDFSTSLGYYKHGIDTEVHNVSGYTSNVSSSSLVIQLSNIPTDGGTGYAQLYNTTDSSAVASSEVSANGPNGWTRVRSGAITLTTGKEYQVQIKKTRIANAKLILDQSDVNGISAIELIHHQITAFASTTSNNYSSGSTDLTIQYNPGNFGVTPTVYFEAVVKTAAGGTAYVQPFDDTYGTGITGAEVTTTNTNYTRVRSGDITVNMPTITKVVSTHIHGASSKTSLAAGYFVIQISNLPTNGGSGYAQLYNLTDGVAVAGSEVTAAGSANWTRVRSGAITLISGKEYVVQIKSGKIANAKVILDQADINGITATEILHPQIGSLYTTTSNNYGSGASDFYAQYDPINFGVTPAAYLETTMKTGAGGTAYVQLNNDTIATSLSGSEITTTSTNYSRVRSGNITASLPVVSSQINPQGHNVSNKVYVSSSWLVLQLSNIPTDGGGGYAQLYNLTDGTAVSGSEVTVLSNAGWTRVRSSAITLTSGKDYVVQFKNGKLANAKLILDQTDVNGITATELIHQQINTMVSTNSNSYGSVNYFNEYNLNNFGVMPTVYFEADHKTSASGVAYAQLYDDFPGTTIPVSQITTSNTGYTRVRSNDLSSVLPFYPRRLDVQIKNNSGGYITYTSSSWLVLQLSNIPTNGGGGYAQLYNVTDSSAVAGSEITVPGNGNWTYIRSNSFSLTPNKEYIVQIKSTRLTNAKLILSQTDTSGIKRTQLAHEQIIKPSSLASTTYTNQTFSTYYDPANYNGGTFKPIFETTMKTSAGTGYAQAYNVTGASLLATSVSDGVYYSDAFSDSSVGAGWSTSTPTGSISEGNSGITITTAASGGSDWGSGALENAPIIYRSVGGDFTAMVKLQSYNPGTNSHAGIMIYRDRDNVYFWGRYKNATGSIDNYRVDRINGNTFGGNLANLASTTLPMWLRVRKSGTTLYFDYSPDGITYTNTYSVTQPFVPTSVGLFAKNWSTGASITPKFNDFVLINQVNELSTTNTSYTRNRSSALIFPIAASALDTQIKSDNNANTVTVADSRLLINVCGLENAPFTSDLLHGGSWFDSCGIERPFYY